jgi:hypothetical protein
MKKINNAISFLAIMLLLNFISNTSNAQSCVGNQVEVCLKNITQTGPGKLEMDLVIKNTGSTTLGLAALAGGFVYPVGMIPAGATMTGTIIKDPCFASLNTINTSGNVTVQTATRQVRWAHTPIVGTSVPLCSSGTFSLEKIFAHITLQLNSGMAWPANFVASLPLNTGLSTAYSNTIATVYCNGGTNSVALSSSTSGTMVMCSQPTITLSPSSNCPSYLYASSVNTCCCGGSGQAKILYANGINAGTYSLNGSAQIPYTANPFSISGLAAGTYSIVVSPDSCTPLTSIFVIPTLSVTGVSTNTVATACNSYLWTLSGQTYTSSGNYTQANTVACSIDSLNLTINGVNAVISQTGNILSSTNTASSYQWVNCATNMIITGATSQSFTATFNGQYKVVLTQGNCSDTSACVVVTGLGVSQKELSAYKYYPNPTSGIFTIERAKNAASASIQIFNTIGNKVFQQNEIQTSLIQIDMKQFASGIYFLKIIEGDKMENIQVSKQ